MAAVGLAALAAFTRLSTTALVLVFLRWLVKTGSEKPQVLQLAIPILKTLPSLLREDRHSATSLRQLIRRPAQGENENSTDGGDAPH